MQDSACGNPGLQKLYVPSRSANAALVAAMRVQRSQSLDRDLPAKTDARIARADNYRMR